MIRRSSSCWSVLVFIDLYLSAFTSKKIYLENFEPLSVLTTTKQLNRQTRRPRKLLVKISDGAYNMDITFNLFGKTDVIYQPSRSH